MGMFSWLKETFGGAASLPANAPDEVGGLNFGTAIEAHNKWKVRLEDFIAGRSTEKLEVAVISRDDQCMLGKWLHGTGREKYANAADFPTLVSAHATFHQCAGEILQAAQAGKKEEADRLLRRGKYMPTSHEVKTLLTKVYMQVHSYKH